MENQEMVMEKSWKHILSSLWEPCNVCIILFEIFDLVFKCILFIINMNMLLISIMFPYPAEISLISALVRKEKKLEVDR